MNIRELKMPDPNMEYLEKEINRYPFSTKESPNESARYFFCLGFHHGQDLLGKALAKDMSIRRFEAKTKVIGSAGVAYQSISNALNIIATKL